MVHLNQINRRIYQVSELLFEGGLKVGFKTGPSLSKKEREGKKKEGMFGILVGFCTGFFLKCVSNAMSNQRFLYRPWEHMLAGGVGAYICYNMDSWDKQLLGNSRSIMHACTSTLIIFHLYH